MSPFASKPDNQGVLSTFRLYCLSVTAASLELSVGNQQESQAGLQS